MVITIIDIIEAKLLDYWECPSDAKPERIRMFWWFILVLFILSALIALGVYILMQGDKTRQFVVGVALLVIGGVLMWKGGKMKSNPKTRRWWIGELPWYRIFGI